MKKQSIISTTFVFLAMLLFLVGCKEDEYTMGALNSPTNLNITTTITGQDANNPNGDGSGEVVINASADNVMTYKIGFSDVSDLSEQPSFEPMPKGTMTHKFNKLGDVTYRITVVAYGAGGSSTTATKDITVKSVYDPDPTIVQSLTGGATKTWRIQSESAGHLGVGPYNVDSFVPEWYAAGPNEKATVAPCFYSARFTFTQVSPTTFSINAATPDGAFTKTGALSGIPNIPSSGDEGCYPYAGGTTAFAFVGATSGIGAENSTQTSILLQGATSFIGYGATKKEYEILSISDDAMHLRVQGTETGNAWYLKLVPVQ